MLDENSEKIHLLERNELSVNEQEDKVASDPTDIVEPVLEEGNQYKCGFCGFAPNWCQVFNSTKWSLFFLGLAAFIQGIAGNYELIHAFFYLYNINVQTMSTLVEIKSTKYGAIVNGMLHFFISTIERRFEMPSYQSGIMSGAFDMASMVFLIPVTYLGGRVTAHKPKWIATGTLIVAVGSFVFSMPHFIAGKYKSKVIVDICIDSKETPNSLLRDKRMIYLAGCTDSSMNSFSVYFWILFMGNFLHGAGGTPLFTLCIAFIDESVPQEKSSLYLGLYYFIALLGPSVGYGLGGVLIHLYVDFPTVKASEIGLYPKSPSWVGCWWLGFIFCGCIALVISAIIYCMPKELKGSRKVKQQREGGQEHVPYQTLRELPKAFTTLLSNLIYMCVCAVACCEGLLVSGFGAFMPKILEKEFNLSSEMVAIVMGLVALPSALLGLVLGGWLVNYLRLGVRATLRFDILLFILATLCIPALLIGCPMDSLVGVNHPYIDDVKTKSKNYSLFTACNMDCSCSEDLYSPVCGRDNLQYFSACFAGCTESKMNDATHSKNYYNCRCITSSGALSKSDKTEDEEEKGGNTRKEVEATSLPCQTPCPLFPLYLFMFFLYQLFTFTAAVPAISVMLRSVNTNLKSLALGLQWILSRLLGTIPGPVLFGAIMDASCLFWYSPLCISKGVCLLYHHFPFRVHLALVALAWKLAQIFFFSLALFFLKKYPIQEN